MLSEVPNEEVFAAPFDRTTLMGQRGLLLPLYKRAEPTYLRQRDRIKATLFSKGLSA